MGQRLAADLQHSLKELGELLLLKQSVLVVVELSKHLFGTYLCSDENLRNLGEDLVLPPKNRVVALQALGEDLDLSLKVPLDVLVDLVVQLRLFVLTPLLLENHNLLVELDLLFDEGVVLHLGDVKLAADLVVVGKGHRVLELVEQNPQLEEGFGFPLL